MDVLGSQRHSPEFEAFVHLHGTRLLRSAFFLTGERATAEDLVQATLLATFTHWAKAQESPAAYSNRVMVNLCRDRWRQEDRRRREVHGNGSCEAGRSAHRELDPTADEVEAQLQRSAMLDIIQALPDRQREVLVLRFYLDQSVPEISRALGIAEGTVKSSLSRAIDRLRLVVLPEEFSPIQGGS
jgi:RNA polymerase sigma-70 factor (sigma-E family)